MKASSDMLKLALVSLFLMTILSAKADTALDSGAAKANELVGPFVQELQSQFPAVAVVGLISAGGTRVLSFGNYQAGDHLVQPNGDSIFMIGSVQKILGGLLFADRVARQEVRLDQNADSLLPPGHHMPVFPGAPEIKIRLIDLANFSSGLPDRIPGLEQDLHQNATTSEQAKDIVFRYLDHYTLPRAPNTEYEYSNISAPLLGLLMAEGFGKTYADVLKERVLAPLQMGDTAQGFADDPGDRLVRGYNLRGELGRDPREWVYSPTGSPQTHSTVNDFCKLIQAHLGLIDTPLKQAIQLMESAPSFQMPRGNESRFFWTVVNGKRYGKNGAIPEYGYTTMVLFNTSTQTGTIVFSNTSHSKEISQFGREILAAMNGDGQ